MSDWPESWKHATEQLPLVNAKQRQVLDFVERGYTNQEIADRLEITLSGAKWHVSELLSKLGLTSREEMAEFWAWQRSRRGLPQRLGALVPAVLRGRWVGWAASGAVAVGLGLPLLLLRAGGDTQASFETPSVSTITAAPTAGPAAQPTLPPSLGVATYVSSIPAAGPDGRIAFLDPRGNLLVQAMPSGTPVEVRTAAGIRKPRWSPSGEYLAVIENGFLIVLSDGQMDIVANPNAGEASWDWSPVADVLAVFTSEGFVLWDAQTGARTTLRGQGAPHPEQPGSVIWSPDGTRILYSFSARFGAGIGPDFHEVRVVNPHTGEDSLLIERETPAQSTTEPVEWSADGEWVYFRDPGAFTGSGWVGSVALHAMPAGGGLATRIGTLHRGLDALNGSRMAAFIDGGFRFAVDPGRRVKIVAGDEVSELEGAAPGTHSDVEWAPDGARLAYIAMPDPPANSATPPESLTILMNNKLWVQRLGGQAVQLTDDPAYRDEHPVWSADGETILFARIDSAGKGSVWRINADGGAPVRVVDELGFGPQGVGGVYGWVQWEALVDWWQPRVR